MATLQPWEGVEMQKWFYSEENFAENIIMVQFIQGRTLQNVYKEEDFVLRNNSDASANNLQCSRAFQRLFAKVSFHSNFDTILCNAQGPLRGVWVGEGGRAAAASLQHLHQPPARFSSGGQSLVCLMIEHVPGIFYKQCLG